MTSNSLHLIFIIRGGPISKLKPPVSLVVFSLIYSMQQLMRVKMVNKISIIVDPRLMTRQ